MTKSPKYEITSVGPTNAESLGTLIADEPQPVYDPMHGSFAAMACDLAPTPIDLLTEFAELDAESKQLTTLLNEMSAPMRARIEPLTDRIAAIRGELEAVMTEQSIKTLQGPGCQAQIVESKVMEITDQEAAVGFLISQGKRADITKVDLAAVKRVAREYEAMEAPVPGVERVTTRTFRIV